jgi:hypothetical protein
MGAKLERRQDYVMARAVAGHVEETLPGVVVKVYSDKGGCTIEVLTPQGNPVRRARIRKEESTILRLALSRDNPCNLDLADPASLDTFLDAVCHTALHRLDEVHARLADATAKLTEANTIINGGLADEPLEDYDFDPTGWEYDDEPEGEN